MSTGFAETVFDLFSYPTSICSLTRTMLGDESTPSMVEIFNEDSRLSGTSMLHRQWKVHMGLAQNEEKACLSIRRWMGRTGSHCNTRETVP